MVEKPQKELPDQKGELPDDLPRRLEYQCSRVLETQSFRILEFQSSKVPEYQSSRVPKYNYKIEKPKRHCDECNEAFKSKKVVEKPQKVIPCEKF